MAPAGSDTGAFNLGITSRLYSWNVENESGIVFDSSTGFTLKNAAIRSPDGAFILKARWNKVASDDRKKFAHICPDFVIERLSESDHEWALQNKM